MIACKQTKSQNVLQHGISVAEHSLDIYNILDGKGAKFQWRLPQWFTANKEFIKNNIADIATMTEYLVFHDSGKPYCRNIDKDGRNHFGNHADVSQRVWKRFSNSDIVCMLISSDMDMHTIKADDVELYCKNREARMILTSLVAALCEIHANAEMFGGIESDSFKIKFKRLESRGKSIMKLLNNDK